MRYLVLPLSMALAACGTTEDWQSRTVVDLGSVCLYDDAQAAADGWMGGAVDQVFSADAPAVVGFVAADCLSSSCSRNSATSCGVSLDGTTLTITGTASYEHNVADGVACTSDCGILSATCVTPALPAGNYTVVFDGLSGSLTIPSTGTLCLDTRL